MSEQTPDKLKILCVFCNAEWTASMEASLYTTQGCDTCGYGAETRGTIEVTCDNCGHVVYRKEYK